MAVSTLRAAATCGLLLCLAGLRGADGFPSGTLLASEGGNDIKNATLLVAYAADGTVVGTVNQSASIPGLFLAEPPAVSPDGKYAFQPISLVNVTSSVPPILVTDLENGTVATVTDAIQVPENCSFSGLGGAASAIAIGHGHAPGTYFLWSLLVCANGKEEFEPSGIDYCDNQYLVRYIYAASTKALVFAEQYNVSSNYNCKTSWATKDVAQLSYVNGTLFGYGYRTLHVQDTDEAFFTFDTHARVFRTGLETPTVGGATNCTTISAVAMESVYAFYYLCESTNTVEGISAGALPAVVLPPQAGLSFIAITATLSSPYVFALAESTEAYNDALVSSPVTVFAVLKATNEVVDSFVISRGAGGLAVVP